MFDDRFNDAFNSFRNNNSSDEDYIDSEKRREISETYGLSGQDIDDYIMNPDLFEIDNEKLLEINKHNDENMDEDSQIYTIPMKRKVVKDVDADGSVKTKTVIKPSVNEEPKDSKKPKSTKKLKGPEKPEGPAERMTKIHHHAGDKFPYGFAVAHEGANAAYMGRVETDGDGQKFFRVYKADSQTNDAKKDAKEKFGGKQGNKAAEWLASHVADTYRDPVYNMPINEGDDISNIVQAAARAFEMNIGQVEGKYKNHNKRIKEATDDWGEYNNYIGMSFPEYVSVEYGEDVTDKARFNKARLRKRLEQLEKHGLAVDIETHKIVPAGETDNDYLTKLRELNKEISNTKKSKVSDIKVSDIKVSDKKVDEKPQGLLGTLKNRGH